MRSAKVCILVALCRNRVDGSYNDGDEISAAGASGGRLRVSAARTLRDGGLGGHFDLQQVRVRAFDYGPDQQYVCAGTKWN